MAHGEAREAVECGRSLSARPTVGGWRSTWILPRSRGCHAETDHEREDAAHCPGTGNYLARGAWDEQPPDSVRPLHLRVGCQAPPRQRLSQAGGPLSGRGCEAGPCEGMAYPR